MDYFLNEYSIRGQFRDIEDFFESLRTRTLPVLKKIEEEKENVIWKKDTFWQLEICNGITLGKIPHIRNQRSGEVVALKNRLIKLINSQPFWGDDCDLEIKEYRFDKEYKDKFEEPNCFSKALQSEGSVVSFVHPSYAVDQLLVILMQNGVEKECRIENIYDEKWWKCKPEIRKWNISEKCIVQVRAKEFDYHPPHFHVICNEYEAVFKLSDGMLYKQGKKKMTQKMISDIQIWYQKNKVELQTAWEILHGE